jgi:hypothetical protein
MPLGLDREADKASPLFDPSIPDPTNVVVLESVSKQTDERGVSTGYKGTACYNTGAA